MESSIGRQLPTQGFWRIVSRIFGKAQQVAGQYLAHYKVLKCVVRASHLEPGVPKNATSVTICVTVLLMGLQPTDDLILRALNRTEKQ